MEIEKTERGWAGHHRLADKCLFRRNTLLEFGEKRVVVSTIGSYRNYDDNNNCIGTIGAFGCYYETRIFLAVKDGEYWEADGINEVSYYGSWHISAESSNKLPKDVDNQANEMHEKAVNFATNCLLQDTLKLI